MEKTSARPKKSVRSKGQTVQSLERGLDALDLAFANGVKPIDVASALGIDRSSAYRLLFTLAQKGYLYQDEQSHKFFPHPNKFIAMASRLSATSKWPDVGLKRLKRLRDITNETANLGILEGQHISYVGQELAPDSVIIVNLLGRTRPANCSALGKVILAFLPPEQLTDWLEKFVLVKLTARSIVDVLSFKEQLVDIRNQGYAIDDEETMDGIRCLAVPIVDYAGFPVGSMGISGPISQFTLNHITDLAAKVVMIGRDASTELGYLKTFESQLSTQNSDTV